jgi:hypothetical protein
MTMEANRIQIEALDAAAAAYIMSELVGRLDAELVSPAAGSGRWSVTVHVEGNEYEALSTTIGAVERALRSHGLSEATVRFGSRSHMIHNPDIEPRRSAA